MAIGVFGLQVAYRLKRLEVMSLDDTYGWFGAGINVSFNVVSTVDRIDFSNDTGTANIRGPLSSAGYGSAATGNSNYGWFGGGGPGPLATVDRIDFSNDSSTASPRGPLSLARGSLAATGNSNYGWFGGGGNAPAFTSVSRVDRIDFSNDSSTASARGPLSAGRYSLAATGNSNYGWFGGAPGPLSIVDRIDFSNDSGTASVRGPLSSTRYSLAATGNSNYGWFGGGKSFPTILTIVNRIDFSNDSSTASVRGPLSSTRYQVAATGNSNYGWFGGGLISSPSQFSRVDRIDFSNDSVTASIRGPLSAVRRFSAATSGQAKGPAIKLQKAGNYGWFGGGFAVSDRVDRIDFSNDSFTASIRGPLSAGKSYSSATSNSNFGWFGGGSIPAPAHLSAVDRIDFSNDSSTASPRGPLSIAKSNSSATGNSNYGWFGGGFSLPGPILYSAVDRIDFSNDSSTTLPRSPLSLARQRLASAGNSNYGWFGGGGTLTPISPYSRVDRIDFSNDSPTASIRGPLSSARYWLAATGNSNYGWFGGGGPGPLATVDRIDFSNDTFTASVRGPLSSGRPNLSSTGNSNYGWFGGGFTPAVLSRVDRIDFSNDSSTASVRGPLSAATNRQTATSNTPIG